MRVATDAVRQAVVGAVICPPCRGCTGGPCPPLINPTTAQRTEEERPACPRMTAPPRSEQAGDRSTCRLGEGGGAADVLKAALVVVPAEQQRAGNGQGTGDRADDRLARLADLVFLPAPHRRAVGVIEPLEDHPLHPDRRPRQPLAHDVGLGGRRTQRPRRRQPTGGEHGLQRGPARRYGQEVVSVPDRRSRSNAEAGGFSVSGSSPAVNPHVHGRIVLVRRPVGTSGAPRSRQPSTSNRAMPAVTALHAPGMVTRGLHRAEGHQMVRRPTASRRVSTSCSVVEKEVTKRQTPGSQRSW